MAPENTRGISGRIAGVNLSSFLQMIEMEQKTCTIKIFTKKDVGRIFFRKGILIDAVTRRLNHLNALYTILSWKNIVIEVEKNVSGKQDEIKLPLMHILMESARRADENENKEGLPESLENTSGPIKTIPLQTLKNREFCLEIGVRLLLDFDGLHLTFRSTLVGIEHGKYLLLKTPSEGVDTDLFKANGLTVKSLYKGTIYAFRSKVLGLISEPSRLMFIEYPVQIEHHELRRHKRFKCSIVAQAAINKKDRGGVIENISKGGCRCLIQALSEGNGSSNHLLNDTIAFRCRLPGSEGEIGFLGEVRNAGRKADEIAVGIRFLNLDDMDEVKKSIHDYIRLIEWSSESA